MVGWAIGLLYNQNALSRSRTISNSVTNTRCKYAWHQKMPIGSFRRSNMVIKINGLLWTDIQLINQATIDEKKLIDKYIIYLLSLRTDLSILNIFFNYRTGHRFRQNSSYALQIYDCLQIYIYIYYRSSIKDNKHKMSKY